MGSFGQFYTFRRGNSCSNPVSRNEVQLRKGPLMSDEHASRRELLKKAAYVTPAILTLKAVPAYAQSGSGANALRRGNTGNGQGNGSQGNNGVGNGIDPQPPGNPKVNDGPGTSPGNPGNKQN